MVLDFRCERCGKLLRAPDDTAGRQSRCPECGNVQTIPSSSTVAPAAADPGPPPVMPAASGSNPFASQATSQTYTDPNNPYAAPMYDPRVTAYATPGAIQPTAVDAGSVLSAAWAIFRANMGMAILGWFVSYIITLAVSVFPNIISALLQASGASEITAALISGLVSMASNLLFVWLTLGMAIFFLKLARARVPNLADLFSATLGQWLILLGASILFGLLFVPVAMLCFLPGIVLFAVDPTIAIIALSIGALFGVPLYLLWVCGIMQLGFAVADRPTGVMDALRLVISVIRKNFVTFLLLFIVNIGVVMLGALALCVGLVVAVPFCFVIWTVAYLMMTGQRVVDPTASPYPAPGAI